VPDVESLLDLVPLAVVLLAAPGNVPVLGFQNEMGKPEEESEVCHRTLLSGGGVGYHREEICKLLFTQW